MSTVKYKIFSKDTAFYSKNAHCKYVIVENHPFTLEMPLVKISKKVIRNFNKGNNKIVVLCTITVYTVQLLLCIVVYFAATDIRISFCHHSKFS